MTCSAMLLGVILNSQEEQKISLHSFYNKNNIQVHNATMKARKDPSLKLLGSAFLKKQQQLDGWSFNPINQPWYGFGIRWTCWPNFIVSKPYSKAFNVKDNANVCSAHTKVVGDWGFDVAEYAYMYNHQTKRFDYVVKWLMLHLMVLFIFWAMNNRAILRT